jgi:hypothetical protein
MYQRREYPSKQSTIPRSPYQRQQEEGVYLPTLLLIPEGFSGNIAMHKGCILQLPHCRAAPFPGRLHSDPGESRVLYDPRRNLITTMALTMLLLRHSITPSGIYWQTYERAYEQRFHV